MQCLGIYAHVGKVLGNNDDDNNVNDLAQVADDHLTVKDQAKLFAIADVHEARKQKWARNILILYILNIITNNINIELYHSYYKY